MKLRLIFDATGGIPPHYPENATFLNVMESLRQAENWFSTYRIPAVYSNAHKIKQRDDAIDQCRQWIKDMNAAMDREREGWTPEKAKQREEELIDLVVRASTRQQEAQQHQRNSVLFRSSGSSLEALRSSPSPYQAKAPTRPPPPPPPSRPRPLPSRNSSFEPANVPFVSQSNNRNSDLIWSTNPLAEASPPVRVSGMVGAPPAARIVAPHSPPPSLTSSADSTRTLARSTFWMKEEDLIVDRSKMLGKGGFGKVYRGTYLGWMHVAVKELHFDELNEAKTKRIFEEEMKAWREIPAIDYGGIDFPLLNVLVALTLWVFKSCPS